MESRTPRPLGDFNRITVWAMYLESEPANPTTTDTIGVTPEPQVVAIVTDDRCLCTRCNRFAPGSTCPEVENVARRAHKTESERRPGQRLMLDSFTMPTYFTVDGVIREIANQVAARRDGGSIE